MRVVGAEKYGVIAFAQAFIQYFIVFSEYGFTLTATRAIATQREDIVSISKIFSAVMVIKFIIMIICLIIYVLIVVFVDKMFNERFVYYYIFGMVFGNILFPGWLFQGIEKMEYITLLNLLSKTIFTICIFVFIKDTADYFYVPLINSLGSISAGLIAIIIAFKRFKIFFIMPHRNDLLHYVKDGWHIFISTISINFYKMNNVIILGFFASDVIVGYFAISKKLVDFTNQIAGMISQTIYPYINKQIKEKHYSEVIVFLKKIFALIFLVTLFFGIIYNVIPDIIIYLVAGDKFNEAITSLRIMGFVPLIIGINVPAVQLLLGLGYDKKFSIIIILGGLINIILNLLFVPPFSYGGACVAVIVSELFVTAGLYYGVFKLKIHSMLIKNNNY